MANGKNREIRLKQRPQGLPTRENFELVETPVPAPQGDEFLVRNIWMSVDPYMRGRMRDVKSYVKPFQLGEPLEGDCVGQIVESKNPKFAKGDYVAGNLGWREYWVSNGKGVLKVDPQLAPIQTYIGTLGMPGFTAYAGLLRIGEPKAGETVCVSAASGAVGSIVSQIAKIKGCRVVGSAGSDEKVAWLRDVAGIDEAYNYKKFKTVADLSAELARLCPAGIDVYFENVGGLQLEAAIENMKEFGRIPVCGMIARYNDTTPAPGPSNLFLLVSRRLKMQGFLVFDHRDMHKQFQTDMAQWIREGKIKWHETVFEGLEKAPDAFLALFRGENFGKMLVKIGPDSAV
jgi:NADPH-dependent curcumin reductase CurA